MTRDEAEQLYRRMLLELWHADDDALDGLASQLVAAGFIIHQNGQEQHGSEALVHLVRQGRAPFSGVTVTLEQGPVIEGDLVAARWSFSGLYAGGIPEATAPVGTPVSFSGLDLVRVDPDGIAEYWVCSDGAALMAQLGAGAG